ncbi:cytochrome P450 [Nocardia pseudobrasiliensis]|uniref:Cytochrome P450 n=1 Tax=Nocardia pseudobrasiliensis TaxID=45979 RepID=A0A370IB69_9NOCA|nr:cytochrome P450 [Nocardia pseudobrasiliensis]
MSKYRAHTSRKPLRDIPLAPGALPLLGHAVTLLRDPLAFLRSLAGRADAVRLRLGPAEVVLVCDGELTRAVLADDRVFDKGGPIFDRVRDLVGEGLSACAHDTHRRLRPLVQPAFHRSRLPRYGELMAARQAEVIGGWHDGQILNIPPQMEYLAAATLVDTLFTDSIPAHQIPPFITDVHTLVTGITWRVMLPPWLTRLPLPPARHYTDANNRLYHLVESIVATRRTAPESNHHDLIAGLLRASSPNRTDQVRDHITPEDGRHDPTDGPLHGGSGNCPADPVGELRERITPEERRSDPIDPPLRAGSRNRLGDPSAPLRNRITPGETVDQIVTFLIAGAITAADTLSWALAELATKPELQQRLRTEVDAVVGRGGTASPVHVAGLDLTARTITETLRRYPPTWLLTRRTTEDSHLGSRALPAGTTVAFSPYLLHHHPAYYPNPETFDPDRWLTPSPAPYLPFGDGPRRCIGDHFATLETTLALATITARWHLRLYQPDPPRPARSIGLTPHHLRIHLTAR